MSFETPNNPAAQSDTSFQGRKGRRQANRNDCSPLERSQRKENAMTEEVVKYSKAKGIATITLNRPDKANTLRMEVIERMSNALEDANRNRAVKVIVLEGAGDNFCGGFDFSDGLEHYDILMEEGYDPGLDVQMVCDQYMSYIPKFMGLWRGLKPTIAKVHGYCVGGGSELALCADLVVASDDARFGTPYSRVWGCHLTGMWVYRLGLAKAKYYALTGDWISGKEAAEIELINFSYPLEELDDRVQALAERLTNIPTTQLISMKLIVNQAYENMGLHSTQTLGPVLDGIMRNTPEGREFVRIAKSEGVRSVITKRDGPFGDYSQAAPEEQPRKRSEIG
jgi:enoyl-CoA hydratase